MFIKKIKLWLAVIMASVCSLHTAYATDIKEPIMPLEFAKFDVNETYYLYNVRSGELIGTNYKASPAGCKWNLIGSNGSYYFKSIETSSTYQLYRGSYQYTSFSTSSRSSWNMNCVDKEKNYYTFSYYSSPDSLYLGFTTGDTLFHKLSLEQDVVWGLLPAASHSRYLALKDYYELLGQFNKDKYNFIDYETQYMEFYNNPNSAADEIAAVADELRMAINYGNLVAASEVPIWIHGTDGWSYNKSSDYLKATIPDNGSVRLSFTINCEDVTQLYYEPDYSCNVNLYVDGVLEKSYTPSQMCIPGSYYQLDNLYFHLQKGKHQVEIEFSSETQRDAYLYAVGAELCPQISVSLPEPGSLGTEALYHVEHLKDVRNLKIKGKLNDDDWSKIDMMVNLNILDLSEADVTEIPSEKFSGSTITRFILPKNLKKIGRSAFYRCKDEDLVIPESVETIEHDAFYYGRLRNVNIPNVTSLGTYVFCHIMLLTDIVLSDSLELIPENCFYHCSYLKSINGGILLPKSVKEIGASAFFGCGSLNLRFNDVIESIGYDAFRYMAIDSLFVPECLQNISSNFAVSCGSLKYVELPTSFYKCSYSGFLNHCDSVNTLVLKSPTVIGGDRYDGILNGVSKGNVTLRVPDYLVNAYKLDEFWYNFKIEGFSTEDVDYWEIQRDLTLYGRDRFNGNPDISLTVPGGLKILGEEGMNINNLTVHTNYNNTAVGSRIICSNDGIKLNGELCLKYYTSVNKWYFISLPFDIKVSEIVPCDGAKYAIRYYDGANRAANGTGGNWKNYSDEDIIEAGTGFIYQTSKTGWNCFYPTDDESKQYLVSNNMFVKALEENASAENSNKGWNLVGNPWQAYFNNHALNFTAPITVWNGSTYVAYSLIDDDYAIRPNEAFFVQCPENSNSISFPVTGRQMTSEIAGQSDNARMYSSEKDNRQLIDLVVMQGDQSDKTRIVVNEGASENYETGVDASKFFSMNESVPQVYSIDASETEYAINERPLGQGKVRLGFVAPQRGCYTFSLSRNDATNVLLVDNETGQTVDLGAGDYEFSAEQGMCTNRFELKINDSSATSIDDVESNVKSKVSATDGAIVVEATNDLITVYSVDGRTVARQTVNGNATIELAKGTYLVQTSNGTIKVSVR